MGKDLDMAVYAAILGLSDEELITASFLPQDGDGARRQPRAPRMRTLIRASVIALGEPHEDRARREQATLVRNISERGMCLVLRETPPRPGDIVIIRLPTHQEYRAQVRWSDGRACGVHLFERLDVDALALPASPRQAAAPEAALSAMPQLRAC